MSPEDVKRIFRKIEPCPSCDGFIFEAAYVFVSSIPLELTKTSQMTRNDFIHSPPVSSSSVKSVVLRHDALAFLDRHLQSKMSGR